MEEAARTALNRATPTQRVLGLIGLLAVIDLGLLALLWSRPPTFEHASINLLLLTGLFVVVEWRVIHIQFQSQTSSFSLLEIPLVMGIFYVPPRLLVLAAVVGVVVGLKLGRRQPWLKVIFNICNVSLFVLVASAMLQAIDVSAPTDRVAWAGVSLAVAIGNLATMLAIMTAITLTEVAPSRRKMVELILFALIVGQGNAAVGMVAGLLVPIDTLALVLLATPGGLMLGALKIFASERAQRERVEFLYRSTRHLDLTGSDDGLITLLDEAREMFKAEQGTVLLVGGDDGTAGRIVQCSDGDPITGAWPDTIDPADVTNALTALGDPELVGPDSTGPLADLVAGLGGPPVMVAKLATDERVQGMLIIANRRSDVTPFTTEDLQVLGALARQSAVLLHSDQLEQTLAALQKLERRLAHQATHDSLTGLPNRALFDTRLDEATTSTDPFTVLFMDLDDFKTVNDTRGHAAGDIVLCTVAERLRMVVRDDDTVARLGGDEFAILLRDDTDPQAVVDRITQAVSSPIPIDDGQVSVGCSIGIARSREGTATSQLLRHADQAMYAAKQARREPASGEPPIPPPTRARRRGAHDLTPDDLDDHLVLHYQPVFDLARQRMAGVEALVRRRGPTGALIRPGEFLPQASRDGSIIAIDQWVLGRALTEITTHLGERFDSTEDPFFVSVNISDRLIESGELPSSVGALRDLTGPAGFAYRLVVEASEGGLTRDLDHGRETVEALDRLGVRVALDDFGTGHSSLGYLRDLDLDMLKLSRELVTSIKMMSAVVELGNALDLDLVAKYVEDSEQLEMLTWLGCPLAQGYHLARPMPIHSLIECGASLPDDAASPLNRL